MTGLLKKNDDWNYFASQLRIRSEMALGMFVNKWGLFSRPVMCGQKNQKWIVLAAARLHNYCINERIAGLPDENPVTEGINFMPSTPERNDGTPIILDRLSDIFPGWSVIRDHMVNDVESRGLHRPTLGWLLKWILFSS